MTRSRATAVVMEGQTEPMPRFQRNYGIPETPGGLHRRYRNRRSPVVT